MKKACMRIVLFLLLLQLVWLPVQAAVSQLPVANIMVTFFLFLLVFTLLLAAEVGIMCKAISRHTAA